jgi:hypothetical protein
VTDDDAAFLSIVAGLSVFSVVVFILGLGVLS